MFCISRDVMGTDHHLLIEDSCMSWVSSFPKYTWTYGFELTHPGLALEKVASLFHYDLTDMIPESHRHALRETLAGLIGNISVPWQYVLPRDMYRANLKGLIRSLGHLCAALSDSGYMEMYIKIEKFLEGVSRGAVDISMLRNHIGNESNPSVVSTLKTFEPLSDGLCIPVRYNHVDTATGRMTVKDGPRILTLPSRCKDIMVPVASGTCLVQVDFVSLEPRVALYIKSTEENLGDIYDDIATNIFNSRFTRSQMKIATLCAIYGVSAKKLTEILPGSDASTVIHEVKRYFGVFEETKKLSSMIYKNGFLQNLFGRPLFLEKGDEHLAFSHFIQSTAATAAVLGFVELKKKLRSSGINFKISFLIHDAIVVEIEKSDLALMTGICHNGVMIEGLGCFPLSIEELSGDGT